MDIFMAVIAGLPMTLLVTVLALALGTVLAVPLMLGLRSGTRLVQFPCRVAVDVLRGIPQVVWIFLLFYGVTIGGARPSAVQAGIVGLSIVAAAYLAEIFRGALKAVSSGQWEAAEALGFSRPTTWRRVVAPQAARVAVPAFTNYSIALLKDSAIVSTIGVAEMASKAGEQARTSDVGLYVYLFAAAVYIALSVPLGILSRSFDRRLRAAVNR